MTNYLLIINEQQKYNFYPKHNTVKQYFPNFLMCEGEEYWTLEVMNHETQDISSNDRG